MAPTASRKQREIRERETLIVDTARAMLLERGYLGLTMDRIAEAIEYSKGTVYQHFRSKEDLIVAIAGQTNEKRSEFFDRAAKFSGTSRERVWAIGLSIDLFVRLYPTYLRSEQIIHASSVHEKAESERLATLYTHENRCFQTVLGVVRDAIEHEALELPIDTAPEMVVYGLWSMTYGALFLESTACRLDELGLDDPRGALQRNYGAFLDGYGWKPLNHEWDYQATAKRVWNEIFPEEARQAGLI